MNVEGADFVRVLLAPCEELAGMGDLCGGKFVLLTESHPAFFRCLLPRFRAFGVPSPCMGMKTDEDKAGGELLIR